MNLLERTLLHDLERGDHVDAEERERLHGRHKALMLGRGRHCEEWDAFLLPPDPEWPDWARYRVIGCGDVYERA